MKVMFFDRIFHFLNSLLIKGLEIKNCAKTINMLIITINVVKYSFS